MVFNRVHSFKYCDTLKLQLTPVLHFKLTGTEGPRWMWGQTLIFNLMFSCWSVLLVLPPFTSFLFWQHSLYPTSLYVFCPRLRPSSPAMHASRLSPWHFRGNLIWVCLVFPRIPFGCRLSLPPDTKINSGCAAKSSKHHWSWPHYLVFAFQTTPAPLHFFVCVRLLEFFSR